MSIELATGYVSIIPSAKGLAGKIASELRPIESAAATTGVSAGKKMSSGFLGSMSGTSKKALGALGFASIGVAVFKSAEDVEAANNTIIRSTGATGKAADRLLESFERVGTQTPADLQTVASTMADVYRRTGLTGKGLEGLTRQVVTFNRITKDSPVEVKQLTQALAGFDIPGAQMGDTLDRLFVTSQKTGVPLVDLVSILQRGGPILRQFNIPLAQGAGLLAQLDKAGVDVQGLVPGLKRVFTNFEDFGKSPADALRNVIGQMDELIKKGDVAGAQNLAGKIFGSRGIGLVDAAVSGKLSLESLNDTFDATGDGILDTASKTSTLGGKLGVLKNEAKFALAEFGTPLLELATESMGHAVPIVHALAGGLKIIGPAIVPIVAGFVTFKAVGMVVVPLLSLLRTGAIGLGQGFKTVPAGLERTASGLGRMGTFASTNATKLGVAAGAGLIAASSFGQIGQSTEGTITGILGMTAAGAALGSMLPGPGTAIGAVAGAVVGLGKVMLTGGESADEYRQRITDLGDAIEGMSGKAAARTIVEELGFGDRLRLFAGDVTAVTDEIVAAGEKSPAAARRIVEGLKAWRTEAGKPLFTGKETDLLDAAVDKSVTKFQSYNKNKRDAQGENQRFLDSERGASGAVDALGNSVDVTKQKILDLQSAQLAAQGGEIGYQQSILNVKKAQDDLNTAIAEHGPASAEAQAATLSLQSAQVQAASAALNMDQTNASLLKRYSDAPEDLQAEITKFQEMKALHPQIASSIDPILWKLFLIKQGIDKIPPEKKPNLQALDNVSPVVRNAIDALNRLDGKRVRAYLEISQELTRHGNLITGAAEGALFKSRPGGYLVNIAEGGHDEAVVPLHDPARAMELLTAGGLVKPVSSPSGVGALASARAPVASARGVESFDDLHAAAGELRDAADLLRSAPLVSSRAARMTGGD